MASTEVAGVETDYVFQINGISCMDCAKKFEEHVAGLPGVSQASLNIVTGKLIVTGTVDIADIRRLGAEENYSIDPFDCRSSSTTLASLKLAYWELGRVALSGALLVAAYLIEKYYGAEMLFISLYAGAMAIGGWGNFRKAFRALLRLEFNMSVLMAVAILGAIAIGQYEEGATVAFLYAVSEMLEAWTMAKARRSIQALMEVSPKEAAVKRGAEEIRIPVEQIAVGDIMIIRPGEKLAMDGRIIQGASALNEAAITGESIPREKGLGDEVYAGSVNTYGALEVRVTKVVQDNTIAKVIHMVEQAQARRAKTQAFVERFAAIYTPIVILLAISIILIPPLLLGYDWLPWIYRGLTLLVVACPCALVISTPIAIVSAISNAAKQGVLIKGGIYLEELAAISAVAFDKTGTLTHGKPIVTDIIPVGEVAENQLLRIAAAVEARSEHPLSVAITNMAKAKGIVYSAAENFLAVAGRGAQATLDNKVIYIGTPIFLAEMGIAIHSVSLIIQRLQAEGKTPIVMGAEGDVLGIIAVSDEVRVSSALAVANLKQAGIQHTIMLTGDGAAVAKAIAAKIGVDEYRAELLPNDKLTAIQELLQQYGKVAMVGDGINDAPALAMSTTGIAMGGVGTDTAMETADVVLMADDLTKLAVAIQLSQRALRIIRQNISFSIGIKVLALLLIFPGWLTLWMAIAADTGATVLVTLNSLRLLHSKATD